MSGGGTAGTAPDAWPRSRRGLAAAVVWTAVLTGAAGAAVAPSGAAVYGAGAYVVATVVALFAPVAVTAQVALGVVLVDGLLLPPAGPAPLALLPLVAGIVATAELLAVVARLGGPLDVDPRDDLRRAGGAAVLGAGVFGVVALAGELPGPGGVAGVGLAVGACVALAVLLVRSATGRPPAVPPDHDVQGREGAGSAEGREGRDGPLRPGRTG